MIKEIKETDTKASPRDYLANERTFLAWIRTSLGIMAFGFVLERFSLFIKQISTFLEKSTLSSSVKISHSAQSYSSIFGIFLVASGAVICLLAFFKYKVNQKKIEEEAYRPSNVLDVLLTLMVLSIGIFLVIYLLNFYSASEKT